MARILLFLSFILLSVSCAIKKMPLTGRYPDLPISEITSKSDELVWTHLIDFISERGLSVKLIDKSSGFLVMDDFSFDGLFTIESKGKPRRSNAYLVTSSIRNQSTRELVGPDRVVGNFNVRIKKTESGTLINVNLTNLRAYDIYTAKYGFGFTELNYDVQSTGVFEKMLNDYLK